MSELVRCGFCASVRGEPCDQILDLDPSASAVVECLRARHRTVYRCRDCGFIYAGRPLFGVRDAVGITKLTRLVRRGGRFAATRVSEGLALGRHRLRCGRVRKFRDQHAGQSCFIVGNGPSLNRMDLVPLNERYVFGLSLIHLMFESVDLRLSYHVTTDPLSVQRSVAQFRAQAWPTFVCWKSGRDYFQGCEHIHFIRIRDRGSHESARMYSPLFSRDITKPIWDGATVTYVALQIAYYMGFKTVYLIGVDHSYRDYEPGSPDPNHFDPNYDTQPRLEEPPDIRSMEIAYQSAKTAYEGDGRQVLNATVGGELEIFERVPFEEALARSSHRDPIARSRTGANR